MAVRLLHPGVSPHIFKGAQEVWIDGERYDVLNAQGASLLTDVVAPPADIPPALSGGALALEGADLILTAPTATRGRPAPTVTLASLTRDGADVRGEIMNDRIPDAAAGAYVAVWVASNDVDPDATRTATATVAEAEIPDPTTTVTPTRKGFVVTALGPVPDYVITPTESGFIARRQNNG